jgi:hypothetical protein
LLRLIDTVKLTVSSRYVVGVLEADLPRLLRLERLGWKVNVQGLRRILPGVEPLAAIRGELDDRLFGETEKDSGFMFEHQDLLPARAILDLAAPAPTNLIYLLLDILFILCYKCDVKWIWRSNAEAS